jgi:hypothetical protein
MEKSLRERVEDVLREKPYCKDDDNALCMEIWAEECVELGYNLATISAITFITFEGSGALSKKQSILRCRRSLNQKKPETVGKSYKSNLKPKKKKLRVVSSRNQEQNLNGDRGQHQFPRTRNRNGHEPIEGLDPKLSVLTG